MYSFKAVTGHEKKWHDTTRINLPNIQVYMASTLKVPIQCRVLYDSEYDIKKIMYLRSGPERASLYKS